jgi:hypothetical protein
MLSFTENMFNDLDSVLVYDSVWFDCSKFWTMLKKIVPNHKLRCKQNLASSCSKAREGLRQHMVHHVQDPSG